MIWVEYIIDKDKTLFTIMFDTYALKHMKAKCDDYINFIQSNHKMNYLLMFKADTGYRIVRVPNKKKTYKVNIRHPLRHFKEFACYPCVYFLKKNGFIRMTLHV